MDEKMKRASGTTTTSNTATVAGVGTVDSAEVCECPEPGPEKIVVEQVLGAGSAQKVLEFDMVVPPQKPDIGQVIDVLLKNVECTDVTVIHDKVIIRGELEAKVMYVADLPNQPVHAFERSHIRFTRDIEIEGAEPEMKATADVVVEFVDYEFEEDDPRTVHITIVLKFWTRVVSTTEMDVYAMTPVDQLGQVSLAPKDDKVSASDFKTGTVSASETGGGEYGAFAPGNVIVTGPIMPTAGTVAKVTGTATVTGNNVNVRSGPGTNFPVVTKVQKGTEVTLLDQAFGWYRISLADGTTGWIAGWLLSVGQPKG